GDGAYLMAFDTDHQTVYQVRPQHGNEQVREVIPNDYTGTLVTDRFSSYEAEELAGVEQHKCLSHLIRNVVEVVESKAGRGKGFGSELKGLLQKANEFGRGRGVLVLGRPGRTHRTSLDLFVTAAPIARSGQPAAIGWNRAAARSATSFELSLKPGGRS